MKLYDLLTISLFVFLMGAQQAMAQNPVVAGRVISSQGQAHRRAYGKNPKLPSSVDFILADYDANSFLDLVLKENGFEFVYEGKRWLSLKRTGKAQEIIGAVKGKTIAEKCYLFPIPASEFNFNKALDPTKDQNRGY